MHNVQKHLKLCQLQVQQGVYWQSLKLKRTGHRFNKKVNSKKSFARDLSLQGDKLVLLAPN